MLRSTCCDAPLWGSTVDPICSKCKKHCDYYDDEIVEEETEEKLYRRFGCGFYNETE